MKKLLAKLILTGLSLYAADLLMETLIFVDVKAVATAAVLLTILNATVKPVLKLLALPVTFATLGLFSWVISGAILFWTIRMTPGSAVASFFSAMIASAAVAVINGALEKIMKDD